MSCPILSGWRCHPYTSPVQSLQNIKHYGLLDHLKCQYRKTERQKDRKTERQKDRKTERQKDRKTERRIVNNFKEEKG